MIEYSCYLSDENNVPFVMEETELSFDEIEEIVGRFAKHSRRAGQLHGEYVRMVDGTQLIRHDFTKKVLWK